MKTTKIAHLDHVVAWDEAEQRHVYLEDADLVFKGNEIAHVGPGYTGPVDTTIDGKGMMAIPGLVNVHSHPFSEPANKGLTEEYATSSARVRSTNTSPSSASIPRMPVPRRRSRCPNC